MDTRCFCCLSLSPSHSTSHIENLHNATIIGCLINSTLVPLIRLLLTECFDESSLESKTDEKLGNHCIPLSYLAFLSTSGGTPLDPCRTPDKLSSGPGALKATGPASRLSSGGGGRLDPADQIAEKAKQEAYVLQRVASLQREGLWFEKRLPKVAEPTRTKAHWDYLLEEMTWISTDFAQERKWKKAMARKVSWTLVRLREQRDFSVSIWQYKQGISGFIRDLE